MVVALQRDKTGARDCGSHPSSLLERNHAITAHVHYQSGYRDLAEEMVDVEITNGLEISDGAFGGRGPPLQLVEGFGLLLRRSGDHFRREQLAECWVVRTPAQTHQRRHGNPPL